MRYAYPVNLEPEEGGGFVVSFPDVPEALTEGDTRERALAEAADALAVAMGGYVEDRRPIPKPSAAGAGQDRVALPMLTAAKLALYTAMRDQGVTNVALAERLRVSETVVRRLVHPGPPFEDRASGVSAGGAGEASGGGGRVMECKFRSSWSRSRQA